MSRCSVDTNVVIYALSDLNDRRHDRARSVVARRPIISVQVLNEFANVSRRKLRKDWRWIDRAVAAFSAACSEIRPITADTHASARVIAERYRLAFYDACIVASALEARADTLFSEDMQDGLRVERLTVRNPFA